MAVPSAQLVNALQATADRLATGAPYQWTHQGHCNCGHLVQTLTHLSPAAIHAAALGTPGDWAEKARDYCPGTHLPLDTIFDSLYQAGLSSDDIANLERLADPRIRALIPQGAWLDYRNRDHVVAYLRAWALQLEAQLVATTAYA